MSSFEAIALKTTIRALAYRCPFFLSGSGSSITLWQEGIKLKCLGTFHLDLNQPIIGIKFEDTRLAESSVDSSLASFTEEKVLIYSTRYIVYCRLYINCDPGQERHFELRQLFKANLVYWIIDCAFGSDLAYILNSRNEVLVYSLARQTILSCVSGPQKCILYSGMLLECCHRGLILASGTVFKTILLWAIELDANKRCHLVNIQALHGHDGVIFSINYNKEHNILISASDDRSIRIWTGNMTRNNSSELFDMQFWKDNSFQLAHVYYGHSARIWKVASLSLSIPIVISTGEDSSVFSWTLLPPYSSIQKKWLIRNNRIWCIEALDDQVDRYIALGGSDSSIKFIATDDLLGQNQYAISRQTYPVRSPKAICFLGSDGTSKNLCCALTKGLFHLTSHKGEFHIVQPKMDFSCDQMDAAFSDYICLQSNPTRNKAVIASKFGHLCLLTLFEDQLRILHTIKPFDLKIYDVSFVDEHQFICCLADGQMRLFSVDGETIRPTERTFLLPVTRHPWSSCAVLANHLLVIGDYSGNVFAYMLNSPDAVSQFRHVHGNNGVSCLQQRPNSPLLYSSGRNGKIVEYVLESNGLELLRTFAVFPAMAWIGGFQFDSVAPFALKYAFGFGARYFLFWNVPENRVIFEEDCGGGHRSWDLMIDNTTTNESSVHLSYIKQNNLISVHRKLPVCLDQTMETYSSLTRKINCCAQLYDSPERQYFLIGGEDNGIQVVHFEKRSKRLEAYTTLYSHISNVTSIKCQPFRSQNGQTVALAISVGGRSQLVVWKFTLTADQELLCQERAANFLGAFNQQAMFEQQVRKANRDSATLTLPDVDLRYLSVDWCQSSPSNANIFTILIACSDSLARIFQYDDAEKQIVMVDKFSTGGTACLLSANLVRVEPNLGQMGTLCALTSSDGHLSMWSLGQESEKSLFTIAENVLSCRLHEAGINAIDFRLVNGTLHVLSGGDDNALKLTTISISQNGTLHLTVRQTVNLPPMHSCQITGLRFLSQSQFISASIDQRVACWQLCLEKAMQNSELKVNPSIYLSRIADISSIELVCSNKSEHFLLICGEGFELLKVTNEMEDTAVSRQSIA